MWAALRSTLFIAWMAVSVVPYALTVVLASIFVRGDTLYWICVAWLRVVVWGARAKVAAQGKALLARGHWVIMIPEVTRTPRGSQAHSFPRIEPDAAPAFR